VDALTAAKSSLSFISGNLQGQLIRVRYTSLVDR
jgi:hypothetical protein